MSMTNEPKYLALGTSLKELREAQGLATQNELAKLLGYKQQTVSRWEAGTSRPRAEELQSVANILRADPQKLMLLAGYSATTTSFDQPLPLSALSEESFQRFCHYLLARMYPTAQAHPAGSDGHKQHGIDVKVVFASGEIHTFQCKREQQFGPAKVIKAVQAHTFVSHKRFILLSRVASPDSRSEAEKHPDWDIWDQHDLSRYFRTIPKIQQVELIDVFFPGQRFALIGETSAGPWWTAEQFFASQLVEGRLFNHRWQLVGRTQERDDLNQALADKSALVVNLIGNAGGGKSRLLRTALEDFYALSPHILIRVLSNEELNTKSLEDLGLGEKLLVVDDAHDRHDDLTQLLRYVANPSANARLLLVYRPYADEAINTALASFGLTGNLTKSVPLQRPTKADAKTLAEQVLTALSAPIEYATQIAEFAYDSPLSVVVGAQIVAKDGINPQLFRSHADFNAVVLKRYEKMILEDLGKGKDQQHIAAILRVLALIQPVVPDESIVLSLLEKIEAVSAPDASRLIKLLVNSGVLFKRGIRHRLSPDLLADSIIESHCITLGNQSNGYAEKLFAIAIPEHKKNILLNLGRLDWRRNSGDTSNSQLLDSLWKRLRWEDDYVQADLKAALGAAYYQPRQALTFTRQLIREGHGQNSDVCQIINNAAHNLRHLELACGLLWEAGHSDDRELSQHPYHPIRLLKELAAPKPRKPTTWTEVAADFALALIPFGDSWQSKYTPFEVLKGALETEGPVTAASTPGSISMMGYGNDPKPLAPIRKRIVDVILSSFEQPIKRQAYEGATLLHDALRGPSGFFNDTPDPGLVEAWEQEFTSTLERVLVQLQSSNAPAAVIVQIAKSVRWHAFHDKKKGNLFARRIVKMLDRDLETRLVRALADGWGQDTWSLDDRRNRAESFQIKLIGDLHCAYPSAFDLVAFVSSVLTEMKSFGHTINSAHILIHQLIHTNTNVALEIFESYLRDGDSAIAGFAPFALHRLLQNDWSQFFHRIEHLLQTSDRHLATIARCFTVSASDANISEAQKRIFRRIFQSNDVSISQIVPGILRGLVEQNKFFAIELFADTCSSLPHAMLRECLMWLCGETTHSFEQIRDDQLTMIVNALVGLERLDDYHIRKFLSCVATQNPELVLDLARTRLSNEKKPFGGHHHVASLALISHPRGPKLLFDLLNWGVPQASDYGFTYRFTDLIDGAFGLNDEQTCDVLASWAEGGDGQHFRLLSILLCKTHSSFVLKHGTFIKRILSAARNHGRKAFQDLNLTFQTSATSGTKSGSWGQPFPEDLKLKAHAEKMLTTLSQSDPTFELYSQLLNKVDRAIKQERVSRDLVEVEIDDE